MIIKELRKKLFDVYAEWYSNLSKNAVIKDENISLPYFIYLPDNWAVSPIRILIVGEEGYGYIGGQTDKRVATGDVISKIQNFNHNYFSDKTLNRRPFWRRISYLRESFPNACFCWTNLDKVHRLKAEGSKSSCKLLKAQREALHEYPILHKEIAIIHPTHVIFCGWYGYSLEKEFNDFDKTICDNLYQNGSDGWKSDGYCTPILSADSSQYLFTYHPGWCTRNHYEDSVREKIRDLILNFNTKDDN